MALVALMAMLGVVLTLTTPVTATAVDTAARKTVQPRVDTWKPKGGGTFNIPTGSFTEQYRIHHLLKDAVKHSKKNSTIRIAVFSFDRRDMAEALINAHKRGVNVQVLINEHQYTRANRMLRRELGHNRHRRSWIRQCENGCRGGSFLHTKIYLFSKSGAAEKTVMIGSANLTSNAILHQWNDLWVRNGNDDLYRAAVNVFQQMKADKRARPMYQVFNVDHRSYQLQALPFPRVTPKNDPIMKILDRVHCKGAKDGTGTNGRTKVRVSQHRWSGGRGAWLARKAVNLWANGCDVRLMYGSADSKVREVMSTQTSRGRVPLRANGFDETGDGELDRYSHHKYMTISGNYLRDNSKRLLMTGSSNWANIGTKGDELIFLAEGRKFVRQWNANFDYLWNNGSRPPTYHRTASGRMTFPEPKPTGKYWEND